MENFKALIDGVLAATDQWSTEMKALAVIGGAIGALGTIITTLYKGLQWLRGRPGNFDADALAEALIRAQQKLGLVEPSAISRPAGAPSDIVQQIAQLKVAISDLQAKRADATKQQQGKIDQALALLQQGRTEQAEALFAAAATEEEAKGKQANQRAARAHRNIGALAFLSNTQKALTAYRKAVELDPDDPGGWNLLGLLLTRVGQLHDAADAFETARALSNRLADKNGEAAAYGNLGVNYRTRGDVTRAEEMTLKSLKLYEELGRKEGMATAYAMLALIYQRGGDPRAEEMTLKGLKLFEELGLKEGMAAGYTLLGGIYQLRGDPRAEENVLKGLNLFKELGTKAGMAAAYTCLGGIYHMRGDPTAEEMTLTGLKLYQELAYKEGMTGAYTTLGMIYQKRGDLTRAEEMILKSLKLHEELRAKDGMAAAHGLLGEIYQQQGDKLKACTHWCKARDIYATIGVPNMVQYFEALMRAANCCSETSTSKGA